MGVFDTPKGDDNIIEIRNPEEWGSEYCRARKTIMVADREWVENQQVQIKRAGGNRGRRRHGFQQAEDIDIQFASGESDRLWVFRMLIDWNFTKDGMSMPLTLESVKELPDHVLDYIWDTIQAAQPAPKTVPGGEEGSENPTLIGVSGFIGGAMSKEDPTLREDPGERNYLTKF